MVSAITREKSVRLCCRLVPHGVHQPVNNCVYLLITDGEGEKFQEFRDLFFIFCFNQLPDTAAGAKNKKIEPIKVNFSASVKRLKGSEVNLQILIAFENRETDVRTGQKEVPWMKKKYKEKKKKLFQTTGFL